MDFFKSVFSDDPEPEQYDSHEDQAPDHNDDDPELTPDNHGGAWSFGGLMKTLVTKSESVIENYRRDLEEFGSGFKMETAVIREVASRAVKDLPASLEVGASVAQESLESVGQAVDDIGSTVWKSTAEIISHGREALLAADDDSDSSESNRNVSGFQNLGVNSSSRPGDLKQYSRFYAQLRAIQCDTKTYLEEPEDLENFSQWKLGFVLEEKVVEIESLAKDNRVIGEIYEKFVPSSIDREGFWSRYFYSVHKLKQAEEARAKLVKRAISGDEEEDLSWELDDDEEEEEEEGKDNGIEPKDDSKGALCSDDGDSVESGTNEIVRKKIEVQPDEQVAMEGKDDGIDSCKASDVSVASSQPWMPGEEYGGWDKIEDIGSIDDNKGDEAESTNRIDLRKRLSLTGEEEDLSWDIEDDDQPPKA